MSTDMKYEPITEFSAERCEILAQIIEQQPHTTESAESGFCLNRLMHPCGTPSCIEGFARSLLDLSEYAHNFKVRSGIQAFTGCEEHEAERLYWGEFSRKKLGDITPQEAAAAIRALAANRKKIQKLLGH
jgi:hypothetical protein